MDAASRLAEIYAEKVQQLETSLNHPAVREEATTVLRVLIDRIELLPRGDIKGVDAVRASMPYSMVIWPRSWPFAVNPVV